MLQYFVYAHVHESMHWHVHVHVLVGWHNKFRVFASRVCTYTCLRMCMCIRMGRCMFIMRVHVRVVYVHVHVRADGYLDFVLRHLVHVHVHVHMYVHVCIPSHRMFYRSEAMMPPWLCCRHRIDSHVLLTRLITCFARVVRRRICMGAHAHICISARAYACTSQSES